MKESVLATFSDFATHKKICSYLSLLLLLAIPVAAKEPQPNILFIVVDNQPASILGSYGNPDVKTPNIDRLAEEGVRFTSTFAVQLAWRGIHAEKLPGVEAQRIDAFEVFID